MKKLLKKGFLIKNKANITAYINKYIILNINYLNIIN